MPLRNSIEDLQNRMMLTAPQRRAAVLDDISASLSQMRAACNGRAALLILSDGDNNHSRYNEGDWLLRARPFLMNPLLDKTARASSR